MSICELCTCDFCGTDTVGVFKILPPTLTPTDDQRRVVLYKHYEKTLNEVVTPLLSRPGVDANVDVADDVRAETDASATPEQATSGSGGGAASVDVSAVDSASTPPEPVDHDSPDEGDDAGSPGDDANDNGGVNDEAEVETKAETRTETENGPSTSATDKQSRPGGESGRGKEPPKFRKVTHIL